ncbi:hypothetical protein [Mitsuaria sp. GD03876]|uniref:hypothetical protein n=1 Tax=Mitsuaria sp. GD03876 TaxID=2975399 RepID=UPI002449FD26|nr:hypothetical protein [Mitsuaria sp. GD03876]MDH0866125.1 hypothetical protein [Mitsuaria sp. GD03876]
MTHPWRFFRAGGADQARIDTADDLLHLRDLDQKRWVALACPTRGLEFDERTLDLIDLDRDGRIRAPELIAACEWTGARLRDWQPLLRGEARLAIASLADTDEGRALADELRRTLALAGHDAQADIGLDEIRERQSHLAAERHNGDGIVPIAAIEDATERALAQRIGEAFGTVADAGGEPGIDETRIAAFFDQAATLLAWHGEGEAGCAGKRAAAMAVQAVHDKVEDFFARCRLASYDATAAATLNATDPEQLKPLAATLLSLDGGPLKQLPAAPVAAGAQLPLDERANPAWRAALATLREQAVRPLLGRDAAELGEADWHALKDQVQACRAWLAQQPAGPVAALGVDAVAALAGERPDEARARLLRRVADDRAAAPRHAALNDLEKLVLLQRDLLRLARNFVSFEDFYEGRGAVFQAGTLYVDGRACELTVEVADPARHAPIAGLAKAYLAYCECVRLNQKRTVVAVVSAGDVDFLFVGRNGLFYDRDGHDWDARIVKVIENPISVGQAFLSPYKKLVRLVEEQVAKRAAAGDTAQQGRLGNWAGKIATADQPGTASALTPAAPGAPLPPGVPARRVDVGTVAALGVALGSISTVIVGLFGRFVDLGWWIPLGMLGIVLSISGPSMLIAWLKLRQRSLGPILDASGWAINNRMTLSTRLGTALTQRPRPVPHAMKLPERPGARGTAQPGMPSAGRDGGAIDQSSRGSSRVSA